MNKLGRGKSWRLGIAGSIGGRLQGILRETEAGYTKLRSQVVSPMLILWKLSFFCLLHLVLGERCQYVFLLWSVISVQVRLLFSRFFLPPSVP